MQAIRKIVIVSKCKNFSERVQLKINILQRNCTSAVVPKNDLVEKSNYLFVQEQKRQREEVGRIEKITVEVLGPPEDVVMVMNKNLSTPYDCCKHISEAFCQQAPLALVNNEILWDMHRTLPGNCTLKFLNFRDQDPFSLNRVFWRTGSFVLGAVISRVFKENIKFYLYSFPPPFIKSGSFIYDTLLDLPDWKPTNDELKVLSAEFLSFVQKNHKIEQLKVKKSLALDIFEGNPYKQRQISNIAADAEDNLVTLYKVGDHIDMSCGPMIANTSFFGRCSVTAVFQLHSMGKTFYRFQGVALPKGILLNSFAYQVIEGRAARMNEANPPGVTDKMFSFHGEIPVIANSRTKIPSNPFEVGRL